jgi:hypothetical protein
MTKTKDIQDPEGVTAHIKQLDPPVAEVVELIRSIILVADPHIGERIKWNNPSFFYTGEMRPFDPKEYKREIAVLNLFKGRIMLVFPSGSKVDDPACLLKGSYPDGRRTVVFRDLEDVLSKKEALLNVLSSWLSLIEK